MRILKWAIFFIPLLISCTNTPASIDANEVTNSFCNCLQPTVDFNLESKEAVLKMDTILLRQLSKRLWTVEENLDSCLTSIIAIYNQQTLKFREEVQILMYSACPDALDLLDNRLE